MIRNRATPFRRLIQIARAIAIVADLLQLVLFPLFMEGFASVLDDALDVTVAVTLTWLIGWHAAFLPAFIVEALPVGDLTPTWTIAVFVATRRFDTIPADAAPAIPSPRGDSPRIGS